MRIAIVSDIHGNLPALIAVAEDIGRRGVDLVVNLGDSLSGPLLPRETARFLMMQDWLHLAGNHERQILELQPGTGSLSDAYARSQLGDAELGWIATLKPRIPYSSGVFFCHATPDRDNEYFLESVEPGRLRAASPAEIHTRLGGIGARVIACGHTHVPRAVRTVNGQLLVNPGSVGQPAYEDDEPVHHTVENGSPDARYAIIEQRGSDWSAELIALPYDYESMAMLALDHGRPEWAHFLRRGYVPK